MANQPIWLHGHRFRERKHWALRSLRLLPALLLFSACARIPRESVDLSLAIGSGIERSRAAHLATLSAFHERLATENDEWVASTYVPSLVERSETMMATACRAQGDTTDACARLTTGDFATLLQEAIQFRDDLQRTLEKNHRESARIIGRHYAELSAANEGLTALLRSAVRVDDATRDAASRVSDATGINLDTDAIQRALSEFLEKAGEAGADISELEAQLEAIRRRLAPPPTPTPDRSDR